MSTAPVVVTKGGCPPWPVPNCDGGDACGEECDGWEEFVRIGLEEADAIDEREDADERCRNERVGRGQEPRRCLGQEADTDHRCTFEVTTDG